MRKFTSTNLPVRYLNNVMKMKRGISAIPNNNIIYPDTETIDIVVLSGKHVMFVTIFNDLS